MVVVPDGDKPLAFQNQGPRRAGVAVSNSAASQTFLGNGSTSTPYPITFPLISAEHLRVAVQPAGAAAPTDLVAGQFTYHTNGASTWFTTAAAYPSTTKVIARRELPLDQPFTFPNGGPFSSRDVERALDRIVQQLIQVAAKSGNGFVFADSDSVTPLARTPNTLVGFDPSGQPNARTAAQILSWLGITPEVVSPVLPVFYDAAEREAAHAPVAGALCVQLDNLSVWAGVAGYGDWQYLHLVSTGPQSFDNAALRLLAAPAQVGQLGIQLDTREVWMGIGTGPGEWRLHSGVGGRPPVHEHAAAEIHSLPWHLPLSTAGLGVPLCTRGGRFSHFVGLDDLSDLLRIPSAAAGLVLRLKAAGVQLSQAQLVAIGTFFDYAVASGLLAVNGPKARLLVPVWANNLQANLIDWLHPGDSVQPTAARYDGGAGTAAFSMPGGYIASDMGVSAAAGYIKLQARANEQWLAANWCMAFYTHSAPVALECNMIGGRNDAESGGAHRYFATYNNAAASFPNACRFSPGFTGGESSWFSHGGAAAGLVLAGMHDTNKYRTRQLKAAGFVVGSTVDASGSSNQAAITALSMTGLSYMTSGGPHGQPASLLYSGYLPGSTSGDCDAFATALRNLVIALGAPSV